MQNMLSSRFNIRICAVLIFSTLCCMVHISNAYAQTSSFVSTGVSLESIPKYPEQNSLVTVSLNDYSVNMLGATIQWFVNGVEQTASKNDRSIEVSTHSLGSKEIVKVVLSRTNIPSLSQTITLTPSVIDIIIESDTYVPSFYRGRALPSKESPMRVIALVYDGATGGIKNDYTYKWSAGDTVLLGGPVKGKNTLEYAMPRFDDSELSVEVFDTKGTIVGKKSIAISPTEPQLHFYEYSPLRGLSERVAIDPLTLISEETTLFGEPYFMNTHMDTSESSFAWMIDGTPVTSDSAVPNAIILKKSGESGKSSISLKIITKSNIPQFVMQNLQIIF